MILAEMGYEFTIMVCVSVIMQLLSFCYHNFERAWLGL